MDSKVSYTAVGLFVILLLLTIIFSILWLSTGLKRQEYKTYLVYMNESVSGLNKNAPVKYNGVEVGFVSDIELNLANPQQVILTLKLKPDVPVTTSTEAVLTEQGITGIAYIGLRGGSNAPKLTARPGEKYPVIQSAPSFLVRLDTTIKKLSNKMETLTNKVQSLLNTQNLRNLQQTLSNMQQISATIAKNRDNINQGLNDTRIAMHHLAKTSRKLPQLVQQMQHTAEDMDTTSHKMTQAFQRGDRTIQAIDQQLLPKTYRVLNNMKDITGNMKDFSEEFRRHPSIIVRGKTPPPNGPGES